jgi:hypothetical protein
LVEAPEDMDSFVQFAMHSAIHAERRAIVVVNLDVLIASVDALREKHDGLIYALCTLLAEKSLWFIAVISPHVQIELSRLYGAVFHTRQDAIDEKLSFAIRVREPPAAQQDLFFELTLGETATAMQAGREAPFLKGFPEYLQECLDILVRKARDGSYPETSLHTSLATCALLVFDAALPLKPAYLHGLTIDVSGNRYSLTRVYSFRRRRSVAGNDTPLRE